MKNRCEKLCEKLSGESFCLFFFTRPFQSTIAFFHRVSLGGVLGPSSKCFFSPGAPPQPDSPGAGSSRRPSALQSPPWGSWRFPWLSVAGSPSRCSPGLPAGLPGAVALPRVPLLPRAPSSNIRAQVPPGTPTSQTWRVSCGTSGLWYPGASRVKDKGTGAETGTGAVL